MNRCLYFRAPLQIPKTCYMKQDMKNEFGDPANRDWEAYSRKLHMEIETRQKKLDETIKLMEESDPCHRKELKKEIEQLSHEILILLLESFTSIAPTISYRLKQESNKSVN